MLGVLRSRLRALSCANVICLHRPLSIRLGQWCCSAYERPLSVVLLSLAVCMLLRCLASGAA